MEAISFEELPKAVAMVYNKLSAIEQLLISKEKSFQKEDSLLTVQQAAEFLTLSIPTIYGLVSKRLLPVNKRGKRLYFSKEELTGWIKGGRIKTAVEVKQLAEQHTKRKLR
jgi:excisionase family DNA binding protein